MGRLGAWMVATMATGCVVGGSDTQDTFSGVTALSVELGNGEVYISSSDDGLAHVHYEGGGVGRSAFPERTQDPQGALSVDGGGLLGGGDLWVEVPEGVPVTAEVERGELTIELLAPADINACVAAGELSIGVPAGAYDIQVAAGAGAVGVGLQSDPNAEHSIRACAGAGEIELYVFEEGMGEGWED